MLKAFRSANRTVSLRDAAPAAAAGERIYAIGDVHGRFDLLKQLLEQVEAHAAELAPVQSMHVILLGDLIDRGPESAEVLRFLHQAQKQTDQLIVLLGNHEELMLKTLDGAPGALATWMRNGGQATVRSLGLDPPAKGDEPRLFAQRLASRLPREQVEWLRRLPMTARSGDYLFCHAGLRPGIPIKRQARNDLLWIREDFLEDDADHGAVVVHGHSMTNAVDIRANRIGIDTGAYRTGVLTALYLEGSKRNIISTAG